MPVPSPLPVAARAFRLLRFLLHLTWGCAIAASAFPFLTPARKRRVIRRWSWQLVRVLGVRSVVHGKPPGVREPCLLACNHVSWLDIWVLASIVPLRFVSKADVRQWPVVGWLSEKAGTLFLERSSRRDAARIGKDMAQALDVGHALGIFPEGTTTDGSHLLAFNASLFQPAINVGRPVVAVALRYVSSTGGHDPDISYAGERTLPESLKLILARRRVRVELSFSPPISVVGKTRRELARETEGWIAQALKLPLPHKRAEIFSGPPGASPSVSDPKGSPYPAPPDSLEAPVPALTSAQK